MVVATGKQTWSFYFLYFCGWTYSVLWVQRKGFRKMIAAYYNVSPENMFYACCLISIQVHKYWHTNLDMNIFEVKGGTSVPTIYLRTRKEMQVTVQRNTDRKANNRRICPWILHYRFMIISADASCVWQDLSVMVHIWLHFRWNVVIQFLLHKFQLAKDEGYIDGFAWAFQHKHFP